MVGVKISEMMKKELDYDIQSETLWTDSQITLVTLRTMAKDSTVSLLTALHKSVARLPSNSESI